VTTLADKLRLPLAGRVGVLNAPEGYLASLGLSSTTDGNGLDYVQLFVSDVQELRTQGPAAVRSVRDGGLIWITYPRGGKTRGATDLPATPWWHRRDVFGEITGEEGYVPVAQVAIDDHWTALRLKRRS